MEMPKINFKKSSIIIFFIAAVFILVWRFTTEAESAGQKKVQKERLENYDIRSDKSKGGSSAMKNYIADSDRSESQISSFRRQSLTAADKLRERHGNLKIEYNEDLRVPEVVSPDYVIKSDFLTQVSNTKREKLLRDFLVQNSDLFSISAVQISKLKTSADYTNPNGQMSFVHLEQKIGNIPVFRGEVKAGFNKRGEIIRVINNLAPALDYENLSTNFGIAEQSALKAANYIGVVLNISDVKVINNESNELKITFESAKLSDKITAEKMYFPLEYGVARSAWRVLLWTETDAFYVIVDAQDGTLLWRKNITEYQTRPATFSVYGNTTSPLKTADSPTPLTPSCLNPADCPAPPLSNRTSFTLVGNEAPYGFNDLGWIPDEGLSGTPNQSDNITDGNAVEAGVDRVLPNGVDAPVPGNPNRVFNFNYNPAPGNPPPGDDPLTPEFQKGAVTNAFYVVNRWHDEMYLYGFNEQAGNFQHFNFGRGGTEGDRISAEIQDSSGTNNANFSATADGVRPRMQMYLWTNTTPNRDGSLDAQVLVHETTHGLSNRLHGNAGGLTTPMAAGLGEGWSDLYPLALLSEPSDNLFSPYAVGGYASIGLFPGNSYYYGARRFPYALKSVTGQNGLPHNPLTLANLNQGNCSTFNGAFPPRFTLTSCGAALFIGEVWASALWEVRGQFVLRHGVQEGNRRVLQIVTDAMKISPLNPTILQARDSILAAAQANSLNPETNTDLIDAWRGFAIRGIGVGARIISTNPVNVVEAFDVPSSILESSSPFDFDGDRKTDVAIYRPTTGAWWIAQSSNSQVYAVGFGNSTDKIVPADFTGDGKTDLALFRESSGEWFILRSDNNTFYGFPFGSNGDKAVPADFDGDGKADPTVYRPSNAGWYSILSSNGSVSSRSFGLSEDVPLPNDYDGDGRADLGIFRPSTSAWWIQRSSNSSIYAAQFGAAGDKPTPADFTGDGKVDFAFYRPSNATWYVLRSEDSSFYGFPFGAASDIPVVGDYDGDNKADAAVFRPSDNGWYLLRSTAGFTAVTFGTSGDKPVPSAFLP